MRHRTEVSRVASQRLLRMETWVFGEVHASLGTAVCRIGTGSSVLGLLLSNFASRDTWVGPASIWADPARELSRFPELVLLRGVSSDVLTVLYVVTMLAAAAFVLGWHTKVANLVTLVGFIAIVGQNPVVGGQGDNLIRLTLLWLLLMRTGQHWSIDSRRARRRDEEGAPSRWAADEAVPRWLLTSLHNVGLVGLGAQAILVYLAGGLDKAAHDDWQHGTALYATMQLPEFRPFPWLSDLLSTSGVVLGLLTYAVLATQLFFAPLLLSGIGRRIVVPVVIVLNGLFAIVLGTLWSSVAVIAVSCLFAPTGALATIGAWTGRRTEPVVDWFAICGYGLVDLVDAARYRVIFPVVDWVRYTVLRRS